MSILLRAKNKWQIILYRYWNFLVSHKLASIWAWPPLREQLHKQMPEQTIPRFQCRRLIRQHSPRMTQVLVR